MIKNTPTTTIQNKRQITSAVLNPTWRLKIIANTKRPNPMNSMAKKKSFKYSRVGFILILHDRFQRMVSRS